MEMSLRALRGPGSPKSHKPLLRQPFWGFRQLAASLMLCFFYLRAQNKCFSDQRSLGLYRFGLRHSGVWKSLSCIHLLNFRKELWSQKHITQTVVKCLLGSVAPIESALAIQIDKRHVEPCIEWKNCVHSFSKFQLVPKLMALVELFFSSYGQIL